MKYKVINEYDKEKFEKAIEKFSNRVNIKDIKYSVVKYSIASSNDPFGYSVLIEYESKKKITYIGDEKLKEDIK